MFLLLLIQETSVLRETVSAVYAGSPSESMLGSPPFQHDNTSTTEAPGPLTSTAFLSSLISVTPLAPGAGGVVIYHVISAEESKQTCGKMEN